MKVSVILSNDHPILSSEVMDMECDFNLYMSGAM